MILLDQWWLVWLTAPVLGVLVVGVVISFSASLMRHS